MISQLAAIRGNQNREVQQQIEAMNFDQQPELNGIPANGSNDSALAQHLADMRANNLEYARLQTEEARQQMEGMAAANFQRDQANANKIKDQMAVETMNRELVRRQHGEVLFSQLDTAVKAIPEGATEWTLPMDKLKDLAKVTDEVQRLTGQDLNQVQQPQQQQQRPETFPDGKPYQIKNLPDGNLEVQLITGERYLGDPMTVTQKLAESQVSTKRWGQSQRQQQQQQQPQQVQQTPAEVPQVSQQPSGSLANDLVARQADELAKGFGFSDRNELMQWGENLNQMAAKVEQFELQSEATRFFTACPDFPADQRAIDAVSIIMDNLHLPNDAEGMKAAHAIAIRQGDYQPIPQEVLQEASGNVRSNRPTPPPMLRGNNPEITGAPPSPYDMPMADLRRQAIAQELNGKGPGYR